MTLELALRNLAAWSVQVAVLACAAGLALRLLPLERPGARLAFAQALLAATLLLPLVQPWQAVSAAVHSSTALAGSLAPAAGRAAGGPSLPSWPALVAGALCAATLARLLRLALGLVWLRRLRRSAAPFEPPPWLDALRRELAPGTSFRICAGIAAPATCGLRRPLVLLPPLFTSLERRQQEGIALHELLHVRRGDWAVLLAEELLSSALVFHPAVHWLVGRIRLAREQAVDAEVVRRLGAREAYLHSLVAVARAAAEARAVPAAAFLHEGHLRERVDQLLKEGLMSRSRTLLNAAAAAAAVVLAVSWTASALPLQAAKPAGGATVGIADDVSERDIKLVHKVNPAYPAEAKAEKVEGIFTIAVVIAKDGAIREASVEASAPTVERLKQIQPEKGKPGAIEGDARLAEAALSAVRQWRYQPILRDGKPVEAKATITIRFALS